MKRLGSYIALVSLDAVICADALAAHCADVLLLPPGSGCDRRIAAHPDTRVAQLGDILITSERYAAEAADVFAALESRTSTQVVCVPHTHGSRYPADIGCNVFTHGRAVYGLLPHLWPEVVDIARAQGRHVHNVRQGYAGCCALSARDLIVSADASILRAAIKEGAQTLAIRPGHIVLPGYSTGFIGGASGVCRDTALFFGNVETHPDGRIIRDALETRQITCISLCDMPLHDFGGIRLIPLRRESSAIH